MDSDATAQLVGVVKRYRRSGFQLGPLNIAIGPGITSVVGANGAGKSTLFRLLAGLEKPDKGELRRGRATAVGLMPQDPRLPSRATLDGYLHHIGWLYGVSRETRIQRVEAVLATVGLIERRDSPIASLSGGMARRLALAAALLPEPQMLLLDEPTVGLDPLQRITMREALLALPAGVAVVVSTHLVEDVQALNGSVLVLRDGEATFHGELNQLPQVDPGAGPGASDVERRIARLMAT